MKKPKTQIIQQSELLHPSRPPTDQQVSKTSLSPSQVSIYYLFQSTSWKKNLTGFMFRCGRVSIAWPCMSSHRMSNLQKATLLNALRRMVSDGEQIIFQDGAGFQQGHRRGRGAGVVKRWGRWGQRKHHRWRALCSRLCCRCSPSHYYPSTVCSSAQNVHDICRLKAHHGGLGGSNTLVTHVKTCWKDQSLLPLKIRKVMEVKAALKEKQAKQVYNYYLNLIKTYCQLMSLFSYKARRGFALFSIPKSEGMCIWQFKCTMCFKLVTLNACSSWCVMSAEYLPTTKEPPASGSC